MQKESFSLSLLSSLGIAMAPNDFVAGLLFGVVAYFGGRQIWREEDREDLLRGMVLALVFAVMMAMAADSVPLNVKPQFKMAFVALFAIPISKALRGAGDKVGDAGGGIAGKILSIFGIGRKEPDK